MTPGTWTTAASHPAGTIRLANLLAWNSSTLVPVRTIAAEILRGTRQAAEFPARATRYIRRRFLYMRETPGFEVLAGPLATMQSQAGDCDDLSIMHATLCLAAGIPAHVAALSVDGGRSWSHAVSVAGGAAWELSDERRYSGRPAAGDRVMVPADVLYYVPWQGQFVRGRINA